MRHYLYRPTWFDIHVHCIGKTSFVYQSLARAYAVTVPPCAAACAPFKSSPATYATCCKEHAATAAAAPKPIPQPAKTKPVSNIIKSKLPKPPSTGELHQGQVTFYDNLLKTQRGIPKPQPYTGLMIFITWHLAYRVITLFLG